MPNNLRDDIDKFFECDLYLPSRTIYMGSVTSDPDTGDSGTDFEMAERVIKSLLILDSRNAEDITIIMNNPGGDVYHGLAIYDAIKKCRSAVSIEVLGHAMSMGAVILQAADERILHPNSWLMVHYGQEGHEGHTPTVRRSVEQGRRIDDWMEDLFLSKIREIHPKWSKKRLKDMLLVDSYLSADEAVEIGLADRVRIP